MGQLSAWEKFWSKTKQYLRRARGCFSMAIPRSDKEWEAFVQFICTTYDYPDLGSYRFALANAVMHSKGDQTRINPRWVARNLYNAQAKEQAFQVQQDFRKQQAEKSKAAHDAAKKALEDAAKANPQAGRLIVDHQPELPNDDAGAPGVGLHK